jgi:ABC-2 type transport system ATP-binding protein
VNAPPVIEAREVRVAVDGVVAIERLSLVTAGYHVVLAGDTGALLAALTGVARSRSGGGRTSAADGGGDDDEPGESYVVAGTLLLAGKNVAQAAHVAGTGTAVLDPPLPRWTAEEYAGWGARLAGAPQRAARELGAAALARVGLADARRKTTDVLSLRERRTLVLAQAIASDPEVLVAEAPLRGLEGDDAAFVLRAVTAATDGRRSVISTARLDAGCAEGALARSANHLVVLVSGELALEGPPGELFAGARVYTLTVRSNARPLRLALSARGIALRGGPVRFSAALPVGASTREILEAARATRAAVVEMVPLIG